MTQNYSKFVSITSQRSGQPGINAAEYASYIFSAPIFDEQTRIGELFRNLDARITLEQRKHEKLQNIKKAMLEKMFPKPDTTMPEVRFQGFEGEWEVRKLGEVVNWSKGTQLAKLVLNKNSIGNAVVHYADLYKFPPVVDEVINWSTANEGTEIPLKSLLFPMSDVTPFGLARTSTLTMQGVKAGGDILIGTIIETHDEKFLSYQINTNSKVILPLVTGTTIRHISSTSLSTIDLILPSCLEQTRIGEFFRNLDRLLSLQQRKCEKLQNIKKAMLGKMFV